MERLTIDELVKKLLEAGPTYTSRIHKHNHNSPHEVAKRRKRKKAIVRIAKLGTLLAAGAYLGHRYLSKKR